MANTITPGMEGVALRTSLNEVISESNEYDLRGNFWKGKKLVPIGDSETAQGDDDPIAWINTLVTLTGLTYSASDNMGVGGCGFMPYNDLPTVGDNSIYKRATDVAAKSPDLIIVLGGQNDDPNLTITLNEAEYTGATFSTASPQCGIIGALKGTLKKLRDGSPGATIVLMTNFLITGDEANFQKKVDRHLAFAQIAPLYRATYLPNYQIPSITNIHPVPAEGQRIGQWIARKMYSV